MPWCMAIKRLFQTQNYEKPMQLTHKEFAYTYIMLKTKEYKIVFTYLF